MPVKLTLPTFDPNQPLNFTAWLRAPGDVPPFPEPIVPMVTVRMAPRDRFIQQVDIELFAPIPEGVHTQLYDVVATGGLSRPAAAGLCGDEGWFSIDGGREAFIWDLVVSYTPRDLGNASASRAFFS